MKAVMVSGLPGTGKSFFASRLAEAIRASHVSSDRLRKQLLSQRTYSEKEKESVYIHMLGKLREAAGNAMNIVLDATFYKQELRQQFIQTARELNIALFIIEIRAVFPLVRKRLANARADSDADIEVYKKIRMEFEPVKEDHLVLESEEDNIGFMISEALKYIHEYSADQQAGRGGNIS